MKISYAVINSCVVDKNINSTVVLLEETRKFIDLFDIKDVELIEFRM